MPDLIPQAKETKPKPLEPALGAVDINMLPPPLTADPLMPKPPANLVGDRGVLFPEEGVPGQLGRAEESTGGQGGTGVLGFGELLSRTPDGREAGKQVHGDGGHDITFDVTLPQQVYWRGDAPDEGFIPRGRTTTQATTSTASVTPVEDYIDYGSSSSSISSALPSDHDSIFPDSAAYSEALATTPTTTKVSVTTTEPPKPSTKAPTTTSQPEPSTKEPTTTRPDPTTTKPDPTTTKPEPTTTKPDPTTTKPAPTTSLPEPTTTTVPDLPTTRTLVPTTKPPVPTTTTTETPAQTTTMSTTSTPAATTTPEAATTTLAATTVAITTTVARAINNVIDTFFGTTRGTLMEIKTTTRESELSNLLQDDAGVFEKDKKELPQESSEETGKLCVYFFTSLYNNKYPMVSLSVYIIVNSMHF